MTNQLPMILEINNVHLFLMLNDFIKNPFANKLGIRSLLQYGTMSSFCKNMYVALLSSAVIIFH